ncbi:MAG: hypothetical protein GC152_08665 [Alphaproteobacteria bacterium]|nr:hypothetical protein [Alphaproteobacteria bacterium]
MLIGYARVSTADQNLDLQLDALRREGCDQVYCDEGISGRSAKRPGLEKALKRLKRDDVLVVWRLDRLARSTRHLVELTARFEAGGIAFRSLKDAIDTSTPIGKFYFHVTAAIGELESGLISERTKAGMAAARARGVKLGRPKKNSSDALDKAAQRYGLIKKGCG